MNHSQPAAAYPVAAGCVLWLKSLIVPMAILGLTGCGPNAFVDSRFDSTAKDPRENLKLVAVDARVSSGAVELRRIRGTEAIFDQELGVLELDRVLVDTLTSSGTVEAVTQAGSAVAFLRDQDRSDPEFQAMTTRIGLTMTTGSDNTFPGRNDLAFTSGVVHKMIGDNTNRLGLETNTLQWEQTNRLFRAPGTFTVRMGEPASDARPAPSDQTTQPAMIMRGRAFASTAQMTRWNVLGGSLATGSGADRLTEAQLSEERQKLLTQFQLLAELPEPKLEPPQSIVVPIENSSTTTPVNP